VCIFLILDRNCMVNFSTYIRPKESRSIGLSYNSVYLILACVEISAVTVT